jgi:hypothetical protein
MTEAPTKGKRSKAKTAGIVIAVVIGVAIAGFVVIALGSAAVSIVTNTPPPQINFAGQVETVGFQTEPTTIGFIDRNSGQRESTGVSDNGHYSINLPNGDHDWRVVVGWQGFGGSKGTCEAGSIAYTDMMSAFQNRNFSC